MDLRDDQNVHLTPYDVYLMGWCVNAVHNFMREKALNTQDDQTDALCRAKIKRLLDKLETVMPSNVDLTQFPINEGK